MQIQHQFREGFPTIESAMAGTDRKARCGGKRKRESSEDKENDNGQKKAKWDDPKGTEFTATYHGLTALYKLLEVNHLRSPLFLPRTLEYRRQIRRKAQAKTQPKPNTEETVVKDHFALEGATIKDINVKLPEALGTQPVALLMTLYESVSTKKGFKLNEFKPVATCLLPVDKKLQLSIAADLVREPTMMRILVVQIIQKTESIVFSDDVTFNRVSDEEEASARKTGEQLLNETLLNQAPLYVGMLHLSTRHGRNGDFSLALASCNAEWDDAASIEFRIKWKAPPSDSKKIRLRNITARLTEDALKEAIEATKLKTLEDSSLRNPFVCPSRKKEHSVVFHFLYHLLLRRMTEERSDYSCAWCNMYAGSLEGLVTHLVCSHSRFRFQVTIGHDDVPQIYVMTPQQAQENRGVIASDPTFMTSTTPAEELELEDEELDKIEHSYTFISAKKRFGASVKPIKTDGLRAFDKASEQEKKPVKPYAPFAKRQYFHSRTGAVVLEHEKDYDSDDDIDDSWIVKQSEKLINEFQDVALEEKAFMKKWNRHVREHKILADFMVASSCRKFAKLHGKWLMEHGLRQNFLLHLFNLWDNSLLNSRAIIDCMLIVDHMTKDKENENLEQAKENESESTLPKQESAPSETAVTS